VIELRLLEESFHVSKAFGLLLCACVPVVAQSERGNITGIITDPAGAAVAGADLTVISRDTNAATKVTTTSTGEYNVPNMPPGVYRIEITAPGLPQPLWNGQLTAWDTDAYRVAHDWTISSSMVNHLSFSKNSFVKNAYSANVDKNWKDKVCIKNVIDCNQNFPTINFTEYTTWGAPSFNGTEQPGWGLKDDLSYIRGSHTFKFGFQHQNQNANGFGQQDIGGRADFSFLSTGVPGQTSFPNSGGSSFASFLLGDAFVGRTETIRNVTQKYPYLVSTHRMTGASIEN
jgi:hypothetical protein